MIEGAKGVTEKGNTHGLAREQPRKPISTAKTPSSRYLTDEGVTRGVATEVNV